MNGPTRRRWLGGSLALAAGGALPGCTPHTSDALPADLPVRWVGARLERGHRLRERKAGGWPAPALTRRAGALVLGGGVAGLSALRALVRAGVDDAQLLELEDTVGGNARGHQLAGQGCPLGAHYLPVPGPTAHEVGEWLHEIGLLQWDGLRGDLGERGAGRGLVAGGRAHVDPERAFHFEPVDRFADEQAVAVDEEGPGFLVDGPGQRIDAQGKVADRLRGPGRRA